MSQPPRDTREAAQIAHLKQLLACLREVSHVLNRENELIPLCEQICESLARTLDYVSVWIGRPDAAGQRVEALAWAGAGRFPQVPIMLDDSPHGRGPAGLALRERRAVVFNDLANDPRFAPWRGEVAATGAAAIASVPILFRETALGVLTVKCNRVDGIDEEELSLLTNLGQDIARAWQGLLEGEKLNNTRENLETLVAAIPDIIFFKDGEGRWQVINAASEKLFQTDKRPWRGRTDAEMAGDIPELKAAHEYCIQTDEQAWQAGKQQLMEEQAIGPDGILHTFEVYKVPVFYPDGRRKGLVIIGRDITEARRIENELRLSELMASASRESLLRIRCSDGKILDANPAALSAYGYTRDELLALRVHNLRAAPDAVEIDRQMEIAYEGSLFETRHRRKDGSVFPADVSTQGVTIGGVRMVVSVIHDITRRKQAAQALAESEQRYRLLVENGTDLVGELDLKGRYLYLSPNHESVLGWTSAELQGLSFFGLLHPADRGAARQHLSRSEAVICLRLRHRNDTYLWMEVSSRLDYSDVDHPKILLYASDLTERRRTEAQLEKARDFYLTLLDKAPALIWRAGTGAKCDWFNDTWLQFTGRPLAQEQGDGWVEGVHPEDVAGCVEQYMAAFGRRASFKLEYRLRRYDGQYRWLADHGVPYQTMVGVFGGYIGYCYDITDQKAAENILATANEELERQVRQRTQELADSEQKFRALTDAAGSAIYLLDGAERIIFWNHMAEKIFGWSAAEVLNRDIASLVGCLAVEPAPAAAAHEAGGRRLMTCARKNGEVFPAEISLVSIPIQGRLHSIGIATDVTWRKRQEEALRLTQFCVDHFTDAVIWKDATGQIINVNTAACHLYGFAREEMIGASIRKLFPAFTGAAWADHWQQLKATGVTTYEITGRRKNGGSLVMEFHSNYVNFERQEYAFSVARDITARKATENQLAEVRERFETIFKCSPVGICISRAEDGLIMDANPAFLKLYGYAREEMLNKTSLELNLYADPEDRKQGIAEIQKNGRLEQLESRGRKKDGQIFDLAVSVELVPIQGQFFLLSNVLDISARKRAEAAFLEANQRFEKIFYRSPLAYSISEVAGGKIIDVNDAFQKMFGFERAEVLGRDAVELGMYPDLATRRAALNNLVEGKSHDNFELVLHKKDGEGIVCNVSIEKVLLGGRYCLLSNIVDLSEVKQSEAKLRKYSQENEDLYNQAPCGYHSLDKNGVVLRVNDTELKWLGYAREEMIGQPHLKFLTPAEQALFRQNYAGFTNRGARYDADAELLKKDGTTLSVVINVLVVRDDSGQVTHCLTTLYDNTERRKVAQQLQEARDVAEAANRAKTEFLANMSHEIRTPMNAIWGYAQMLRGNETLPAPVQEQVRIIHRSSSNLLNLLNSILDVSRIEQGKMEVYAQEFNSADLFREVVQLFQERADAKQLALSYQPSPSLPAFIVADRDKLRQIAENLLSNAIEFTEEGEIRLEVELRQAAAGETRLVLSVKDTGAGISPADQTRLFQKFEQLKQGKVTRSGTGLGLYICQEFAHLLGGRITLTSELGKGSSFCLEVPVVLADGTASPLTAAVSASLPAPVAAALDILVADDVLENRNLILKILAGAGFKTRVATTGKEALAECAAQMPDLILMDTRMPEMDGLEAIRCLRAGAGGARLKIITVSASAYEDDRLSAFQAGANEFVAKPVHADELLGKIRLLLGTGAPVSPAKQPVRDQPATVNLARVQRLPAALRQQLREVIVYGDYEQVSRLLQRVMELDPILAARMTRMANQLDSTGLLRLLDPDK